jgi:hypothetical protein
MEAELDAEARSYFAIMVDRYVTQGLPEQEARRLARFNFTSPDHVKEQVRDARAGATIDSLADLREQVKSFSGLAGYITNWYPPLSAARVSQNAYGGRRQQRTSSMSRKLG